MYHPHVLSNLKKRDKFLLTVANQKQKMENPPVPITAAGLTTYFATGQTLCAMNAAEEEVDVRWKGITEVLLVLMFGTFRVCNFL